MDEPTRINHPPRTCAHPTRQPSDLTRTFGPRPKGGPAESSTDTLGSRAVAFLKGARFAGPPKVTMQVWRTAGSFSDDDDRPNDAHRKIGLSGVAISLYGQLVTRFNGINPKRRGLMSRRQRADLIYRKVFAQTGAREDARPTLRTARAHRGAVPSEVPRAPNPPIASRPPPDRPAPTSRTRRPSTPGLRVKTIRKFLIAPTSTR